MTLPWWRNLGTIAGFTGTDADWIVKVIDVFPNDEPETPEVAHI
jgi:hypothetical protein